MPSYPGVRHSCPLGRRSQNWGFVPLLPPGSQNFGAKRSTGVKSLTSVRVILFRIFPDNCRPRSYFMHGMAWIPLGSETAERRKIPLIPREFGLALKVQLSSAGTDTNRAVRRNQCRYKPTSH